MMSSLWPVKHSDDFCMQTFLESPLVYWAKSLVGRNEEQNICAADLCNTDFLKEVLGEIEPQLLQCDEKYLDDPVLCRLSTLENLVVSLRNHFTDILGQIMVTRPPDILFMSQFPAADHAVREMRRLLLLLLGFAVQCGQKEKIIERIQSMDESAQKGIVDCIREVTDNPLRVWKVELLELSDNMNQSEVEHDRMGLLAAAHHHIKNLVDDRDELIKLLLLLWRENYQRKSPPAGETVKKYSPGGNYHAADLAELKAQIRRLTQELYECEEELKESNDELQHASLALDSLQKENSELSKDIKLVKVYRDELDILYEKEKRAEKLDAEVSRYRNQVAEMEYYKSRIEEMQQNCQLLTDTKALLEAQLESARKRADLVPILEGEITQFKLQLNNVAMESAAQREEVKDLLAENAQLTLDLQRYRTEMGCMSEDASTHSKSSGISLSLSDQLTESLSTKVLRLEIENEKLHALLESRGHIPPRDSPQCIDSDVGSASDGEDLCNSRSAATMYDIVDGSIGYEESMVTVYPLSQYEDEESPSPKPQSNFALPPLDWSPHHGENSPDVKTPSKSDLYVEEENFHLKTEISTLKKTLEQYQKLESRLSASREEQIDTRKSLDDAFGEILSLTAEIRSLEESRVSLLEKANEADGLRKEKTALLSELKSQDQKFKMMERENKRIRQSLESRSSEISDLQNQFTQLEEAYKESRHEADRTIELRSRIDDLERSNAELTQKVTVSSDSMTNLQNELVREKLLSKNRGKVLKEIVVFLSNQHVMVPAHIDDCVENGTKTAGVFIEALSDAITQRENEALQRSHEEMRSELEALKNEHELLRKTHEQEARRMRSTPSSISIEATCTINELEDATLEKVRTENLTLKENLAVAKLSLHKCETQLGNVFSAHRNLQLENKRLESVNANLDVEIKSVKSNNSSLLRGLVESEKEKEKLIKNTEESQTVYSTTVADHEALQRLHEQLNTDYGNLAKEVKLLKTENRRLGHDLAESRVKPIVAAESVRSGREAGSLREERLQRLELEYEKMVTENESLRTVNRQLSDTYRILTEEHKTVKTEINQLKLNKIEYDGVVYDCKSQVQSKEAEANRHTEILLSVIASLEDEKRSFASAIERLVLQYDDVFLHSWREKNQMQFEQKELQEKLHALDLQKQLLIQKLYDTFKTTDPRKRNVHVSFLKRVRRAAGELVGRSRSRSRTRTVSPTDSTADSSSVESTAGGVDFGTGKRLHSSSSMHSMGPLRISSVRTPNKIGPHLSYSSDDLRKNSSSASSSCISPTEQGGHHQRIRTASALKSFRPAREGLAVNTDPAFHRVGSRRGIYEPPPRNGTIVHHPAVRDKTPNPAALDHDTLLKGQQGGKASEKDSSQSDKKQCCSSYGGFHDCTMLNYTRLTATTPLVGGNPDGKDLPGISRRRSMGREHRITDSTVGSDGSNYSTPSGSLRSKNHYAAPSHQRPMQTGVSSDTLSERRSSAVADPTAAGYILRPRSSTVRATGTISESGQIKMDSDTASTYSVASSGTSLNLPTSMGNVNYYNSDSRASQRRSTAESISNGQASISGSIEENPMWYEYGCV